MKNKNITKNEKNIVREICKECNWCEKIVVKLLARLFIKVYNSGVKIGYNWNNKYVQ